MMHINLILHNVTAIISIIIAVGMIMFLYFNNKHSMTNIMLALTFLCTDIFLISHLIGVNTTDSSLSRNVFMLNIFTMWIGVFNYHSVCSFLEKTGKRKLVLWLLYSTTAIFSVYFLVDQASFLLPSIPKMYFPNYYNPGPLNWIRVATLFIIMVPLIIYEFADSYFKTNDDKRKRLIKYFTLMVVFGYAFGGIPNFLVYGIHIDPFWGMFTSVFIFAPFLYGAYNYELFDIRFIAKQAFLYGLTIVVAGGVIMLVEYANRYISTINPNFPSWVSPFISGIVFTIIATSVWRQLKKTDLLRYEFITIVTHKFRTPLTHIKWASENLMKNNLNEDCKTQLAYIQTAETKLSQLTDLLARVSSLDSDKSDYEFKKTNISELIFDILDSLNKQGISVDSKLMTHVEPNLFARCDYIRFRFALQVLIENAISYSPKGSPIEIRLEKNNDGNIVYIVKDQGIGIDKKDFNLLFTKFYRTERAQTMDTEGMGIGLYMTKVIVENHKGTITVSSEGQDKGSTFTVSVPGYE